MNQNDGLDQWEISTAVIGLRGAFRRYIGAYRDMIPNQDIALASIVAFVVWVCALTSGYAKKTDLMPPAVTPMSTGVCCLPWVCP